MNRDAVPPSIIGKEYLFCGNEYSMEDNKVEWYVCKYFVKVLSHTKRVSRLQGEDSGFTHPAFTRGTKVYVGIRTGNRGRHVRIKRIPSHSKPDFLPADTTRNLRRAFVCIILETIIIGNIRK